MAIDTVEKRASVHAYSGNDSALCGRLDGVNAINAADRSHITSRYRGIAAAPPGGVVNLFAQCFGGFVELERPRTVAY